MKTAGKWIVGAMLALLAIGLLIRGAVSSRVAADQDEEEAHARPVPSRVSVRNGETLITLDAKTQAQAGLAVAPLAETFARPQEQTLARVLPVDALTALRNTYVSAKARLEKARVEVDVSRKQYDRVKALYQDNENAAQRSVEAAEATLRSNQADAEAATQELALLAAAARQQWGNAVADWLAQGSPALQRILDQQEILVEVTLPSGEFSRGPSTVVLQVPDGGRAQGSLVSPFPRLDPRIQGISLLYQASARPGLIPGANLTASVATGTRRKGVVVPGAAIVWWQGKAWAYQQTGAGTFVRREVPTDNAVGNGWFAGTGFLPGEKIVVRGAQLLFSEEFRSQIGAAEED